MARLLFESLVQLATPLLFVLTRFVFTFSRICSFSFGLKEEGPLFLGAEGHAALR